MSIAWVALAYTLAAMRWHPAAAEAGGEAVQGAPVQLAVSPGATCLQTNLLEARLREWFGGRRVDARLRVDVQGDPHMPRRLVFSVWQGERQLSQRRFDEAPPDCPQMHAVVALAIAIALRGALLEELGLEPAVAQETSRSWALEAASLVGSGFGPGANWGAELGVALGFSRWAQVRVAPLFLRSQRGVFAHIRGTYDLTRVGAVVEGCVRSGGAARFSLRLCSGPMFGALVARGHDYSQARAAVTAHGAWTGRATLELRWARSLGISLGMLAAIPLSKPALVLRDADHKVVHQKRLVGTGVALGLGLICSFE